MRVTEFFLPIKDGIADIRVPAGAQAVNTIDMGDGFAGLALAYEVTAGKQKAKIAWLPPSFDFDGAVIGGPIMWPGGGTRYLCIQLQPINPADPETPPGVPFDPATDIPNWKQVPKQEPVPEPPPYRPWSKEPKPYRPREPA